MEMSSATVVEAVSPPVKRGLGFAKVENHQDYEEEEED
ncbi:unnamed protein product [Rhodiola kirilowii]